MDSEQNLEKMARLDAQADINEVQAEEKREAAWNRVKREIQIRNSAPVTAEDIMAANISDDLSSMNLGAAFDANADFEASLEASRYYSGRDFEIIKGNSKED